MLLADPDVDLLRSRKEKIKAPSRTDFILSAEIIVIALGTSPTVRSQSRWRCSAQWPCSMTAGVYGLVAAIVKLDDLGLYLSRAPAGRTSLGGRGHPARQRRG